MTKEEEREYNRKYYEKNKEKIKAKANDYYYSNKEKIKDWAKKYYEDNSEKIKDRVKKHKEENTEHYKEYRKIYYKEHREKYYELHKKYRSTKKGRAQYLLCDYNRRDKMYGRGECTLSSEWIVDNIFNGQTCVYCGETDWRKLGCDRKDNSKPHTIENVVCCCALCNAKKGLKNYSEYMDIINGKG